MAGETGAAGIAGASGAAAVDEYIAETLEEELKPFKHGRGTVRFRLDRALPAGLVRRIVELRAAETLHGR